MLHDWFFHKFQAKIFDLRDFSIFVIPGSENYWSNCILHWPASQKKLLLKLKKRVQHTWEVFRSHGTLWAPQRLPWTLWRRRCLEPSGPEGSWNPLKPSWTARGFQTFTGGKLESSGISSRSALDMWKHRVPDLL